MHDFDYDCTVSTYRAVDALGTRPYIATHGHLVGQVIVRKQPIIDIASIAATFRFPSNIPHEMTTPGGLCDDAGVVPLVAAHNIHLHADTWQKYEKSYNDIHNIGTTR